MKVVFLGDSLTFGYGLETEDVWTSVIDKDRSDLTVINKGITGDTTVGMLARFQGDVVANQPDIVHIMGSANDFICHANPDQVKGNFMSMAMQAKAAGITPVIGVATLPVADDVIDPWNKFGNFHEVAKKLDELDEWIYKFNEHIQVKVIDYKKELPKHYDGDIADLFIDGLHLNELGNKILAKIFLDRVDTLIEEEA